MVVRGSDTLAGRYRLGETIGTGGMGAVLRGHDQVLDRPVAVKLLKDQLATDPATVERFRREARIAAGLSHPGIASVFDFGEEEGRFFIVMELLDGRDLHQLVAGEGPLAPGEAAGIVAQAADALDHAHAAGAVHRDVKPANIFLTTSGRVKVTDFGIAHAASMAPVTVTGMLVGTPHYLAPEQVEGERATCASDVYALGCVLYHLLTGRAPYGGENVIAVARAHAHEPVPSARDIDPEIPQEIDAALRRAMAKSPRDRFTSAAEMAAALREAAGLAAPPGPAVPGAPPTAPLAVPPADRTQVVEAEDVEQQAPAPAPPQGVAPAAAVPRRPRPHVAVGALALAILALVALAGPFRRAGGGEVPVPRWTGLPFDQARLEADRLGLRLEREDAESDRPAGEVLAQDPSPGRTVGRGAIVKLTVSRGNMVVLPDLRGKDLDDAEELLASLGLTAEVAATVKTDDEDEDGLVVSQQPPPETPIARGASIMLTIAEHEEERKRGKGRGKD